MRNIVRFGKSILSNWSVDNQSFPWKLKSIERTNYSYCNLIRLCIATRNFGYLKNSKFVFSLKILTATHELTPAPFSQCPSKSSPLNYSTFLIWHMHLVICASHKHLFLLWFFNFNTTRFPLTTKTWGNTRNFFTQLFLFSSAKLFIIDCALIIGLLGKTS